VNSVFRIIFLFLFLGLITVVASLNPYHACYHKDSTTITHKSDVFTACVTSSNTFDYNYDNSQHHLSVPVHFYFPKSSNKVPIIIISHGAGGIFQFHHNYKDIFLSNGFAVAIIDHFSPRNIAIDFNFVDVSEAMMLSDVSGTLKHLINYYSHRINGQIGYIGWSKGGISSLSLRSKKIYDKYIPSNIKLSFLGGIYTYCGVSFEDYQSSNTPLLLISGEMDGITPSKYCENLYKDYRDDEEIEYHQLENAHHGFDNHAFLLGAYLPWQPTLIESEACTIKINDSLMTVNEAGTYSLNDQQSRGEFVEVCTKKGAFVKYDTSSKNKSQKIVSEFVKSKFKFN